MGEDIPLSWELGALGLLLVLSAFFSIAETSMMAINRYRLKAMVRMGSRGAKMTSELLAKTDKLLGVILLGNNLINAAAATLVGVITISLFGEDRIALGLGTLAVTFLILVFSEITPKVIGAAYAERIAIPVSYVLAPLLRVLYPVVWFINLFVSSLLFILRIKPSREGEEQRLTMEELRSLVVDSGHFMPKKHQSILVNLFDLEAPMETIIEQLVTSYHTRVLVYRGEISNVAGILHLRRVLRPMQSGAMGKAELEALLAAPYYVPAETAALTQLQYFQENHQRFALVVDEYGEVQGLVTLEDIIEEIVGEFTTTAPGNATRIRWDKAASPKAVVSALVEGSATLRNLNRKLGLALPLDGPKTLNGLILEFLEDIPESGVSVKIADVPMEIVQTQDRVVKTVRLFKPRPPAPAAEGGR